MFGGSSSAVFLKACHFLTLEMYMIFFHDFTDLVLRVLKKVVALRTPFVQLLSEGTFKVKGHFTCFCQNTFANVIFGQGPGTSFGSKIWPLHE